MTKATAEAEFLSSANQKGVIGIHDMLNTTAPDINAIKVYKETDATLDDDTFYSLAQRMQFWYDEDPYYMLEKDYNLLTNEWIYYPEKTAT